MAIEKMLMLHMVGERSELDDIAKALVLFGKLHVVSAHPEYEASDFAQYLSEDERERVLERQGFMPLEQTGDFRSAYEKIERILQHLDISPKNMKQKLAEDQTELSYAYSLLDKLYPELEAIQKALKDYGEEKEQLKYLKALTYLDDTELDLKKLFSMKHFGLKLGLLTKENRTKLALNYENIDGIFMHLGEIENKEAMLVAYPLSLGLETERILRSVYFEDIHVPEPYWTGTKEITERLYMENDRVDNEIAELMLKKKEYRKKYKEELRLLFNRFKLEMTVSQVKKQVLVSKQFFFMAGWLPASQFENLQKLIHRQQYNTIVSLSDESLSEAYDMPPTELRNNWLFRPFELLVKLYGIPSYGEIDPTPFFAVIYMLLFGAMFGDLGQGFVFFAVGLAAVLLKKQPDFGAILSRLGLSSMFFGTIYDSFFGYEHVISGFVSKLLGREPENLFFVRPLENINFMLITSVAVGIVLLFIGFGFGIYNKLKARDIKEGVFGRNGIAGMLFYIGFLGVVGTVAGLPLGIPVLPFYVICILGMLSILFREPVTNLLLGHKELYHEPIGDYYTEAGFETVEMLLTLFSNTMSFIRIGAFALNHVGLFLAFHTIAAIIGGAVGEVSMFIVGNIVIMLLEGLIVFIQGLRLMFYELFSKYYTGEGFDFKPTQLDY